MPITLDNVQRSKGTLPHCLFPTPLANFLKEVTVRYVPQFTRVGGQRSYHCTNISTSNRNEGVANTLKGRFRLPNNVPFQDLDGFTRLFTLPGSLVVFVFRRTVRLAKEDTGNSRSKLPGCVHLLDPLACYCSLRGLCEAAPPAASEFVQR